MLASVLKASYYLGMSEKRCFASTYPARFVNVRNRSIGFVRRRSCMYATVRMVCGSVDRAEDAEAEEEVGLPVSRRRPSTAAVRLEDPRIPLS